MAKQNEANGTASEPISRYYELPILQTYKVCFENMVQIGGVWMVGPDKAIYHVETPNKVQECMWKNAKRYDIQSGKVMGYTNADRIRSMSDEELADFLWGIGNNPATGTTYVSGKPIFTNPDGYKGWLEWLKMSLSTDNSNRCVCCGEPVPEGRMVCPTCERKANE